ncbi:MAG TPA: hypothetical protein VHC47_00865 [Mucilaginibacter sp.]|nr:hypothetical protein [Mucilaginibacter sp.]
MRNTEDKTTVNMVQYMRQIRDEISGEIKDMSFEEERKFLDTLLKKEPLKNTFPKKSRKKTPSA